MADAAHPVEGLLTASEMATLLEASTAVLGVAHLDGRLRWVNQAFTNALGVPRSELLESSYLDRIHPDDVDAAVGVLEELTSSGDRRSVDIRMRHRDGTWRVLRSTASVAGDCIYFSSVDLTDEKRHVEDLGRANGLLSLFGVGVAHDLRSILTVLEGASTQLVSAVRQPEPDAALVGVLSGMLERSIARAWVFIGAMLAVTRGEPVDRVGVHLGEILQGASDDVEPERADADASITWDPDAPAVWASPVLLRATFANLFSNSIRYCPPGTTAEIEVSTSVSDDVVTVAVADNGAGIASDDLAVIFEPFERRAPVSEAAGESELRRVPSGYGLGLALCREVVQAHGGRVWASSEVGKGTTITMELPAAPPGDRETVRPDPGC